jgi:hypothetical protein
MTKEIDKDLVERAKDAVLSSKVSYEIIHSLDGNPLMNNLVSHVARAMQEVRDSRDKFVHTQYLQHLESQLKKERALSGRLVGALEKIIKEPHDGRYCGPNCQDMACPQNKAKEAIDALRKAREK